MTEAGSITPPNYNTPIPEEIMTPDRVETRIGTLNFVDGVPTIETVQLTYDTLDFLRGVEVFLNFIPAASLEALRRGGVALGATACHQVGIVEQLMDSNPLWLTANTDTVYASVFIDLERDGPTVIEVPPGCGPGTVNDAYFRFVVDMGMPGPDAGKGGKYLIAPTAFEGDLPKDVREGGEYYLARSPSHVNWLILRGFLVDSKPDAAVRMFQEGLKIYPLKDAASPPAMEFIDSSKVPVNTIHANTFAFYEELDEVIQREPIDLLDPELRGLAASIGIRKGTPFAPDARMKAILTDAVAVANATARTISFRNRDPRAKLYGDESQWRTAFIGGDFRWLGGDGAGGRDLDARSVFFYNATVNTPAMALKMIGKGSQYATIFADSAGQYFDGARNYRLQIPANVPADDFWSVVIYDPQTRSELQTGQPFPGRNNKSGKLATNADGSTDIFFGPSAPEGKETNWLQTVAGKGWFAILRLYGPTEAWFDHTWRPGEIDQIS